MGACICICAHPPTYDVKGGEGGVRGRPQAPHKHPLSVELSATPPFPCCGLGCGATLLVVLKVREGIHYLFAGVLLFFELVDFRIELRSAYTVTPRGRCVTPSLFPGMCVCGVGLSSVLLYRHKQCCVGQWYALPPLFPSYGTPPPLCALVPGLLVGWLLVFGLLGWLLGWLVSCWTVEFGWLVGRLVAWLVAWLVGCWLVAGVYVCVCTDAVALYVVVGGVYACVLPGQCHCKGLLGGLHISFRRSSSVLGPF